MASAMTEMRHTVLDALNAEFSGEIEFISDKLHPAVALDRARGAVYPDLRDSRSGQVIEAIPVAYVQIFLQWEKKVDPEQVVDPNAIEDAVDRAERAIQAVADHGDNQIWFFYVTNVRFIDDPTGNRSRAELRVEGHGTNTAITETSA